MGDASDLWSLALAWVAGVGPIALLVALLNRRDRRARALLHEVAAEIPAEALRSDVVVAVRCGLLGRRATVRVDLRGAPAAPVWEMATRLRRVLPGSVALVVEGPVDGPPARSRPVRITLESTPLRPAA